jgi:hypothetical protein
MSITVRRAILLGVLIVAGFGVSELWKYDQPALAQVPVASIATRPSTFPPPTTRPVVYIASPYSKGDPAINTHFQCEVWDKLMNDGVVWPVAPLWSHFQHTLYPRKYQDWIAYDMAMIPRYDACLRINPDYPELKYATTQSSGADNEAAEFKRLGKPVFYSIEDLYAWAKSGKQ